MTSRLGWRAAAPVLGLLALGLRLVPVLRGGGLNGLGNYDDGVYFAAGTALAHGLLPYRDFLLLHPPGMVLALLPFGLLGRWLGDPTGFAAARVACMGLGAANALLVGQVVRPLGTVPAALGALLYAVALPAIYAEHTTLLEGPAQTCVLLALLLVRPLETGPREIGRLQSAWVAVGAGVLVGASATVKIWGVAAVLALVAWFLARRAVRRALQVLAGAALAVGLVCLPFFVAAPVRMWQMVVLDQLGRPRAPVSPVVRLGNLVGLGLLGPAHGAWALLVPVALAAVLVLLVLAWTVPLARPAVVLCVVLTGVLLASPSWFLHYPALATGPLCVALAAGGHRLFERLRAGGRRRAGAAVPVLLGIAAVLQCWPLVHFTPGTRFPGASLGREAAGVACVTSDDPAALVEMDVLGRDLDHGCPFVADVGGYSYEVARLTGRDRPRRADADWQRAYVAQLRTGQLSVPFRYVRTGSLSAATLATLDGWPVTARVGAYELRRPQVVG